MVGESKEIMFSRYSRADSQRHTGIVASGTKGKEKIGANSSPTQIAILLIVGGENNLF